MLLEDFRTYLLTKGYQNIFLNYQPFSPDNTDNINKEAIYIEQNSAKSIAPFMVERDEIFRFVIREVNRETAYNRANDIMYLLNSFRGYITGDVADVFIFVVSIAEPIKLLDVLGSNNISEYSFKINVKYLDKNLNTIQE